MSEIICMTVGELIEKLKQFDPNLPVLKEEWGEDETGFSPVNVPSFNQEPIEFYGQLVVPRPPVNFEKRQYNPGECVVIQ
jgi:hypothetical protein